MSFKPKDQLGELSLKEHQAIESLRTLLKVRDRNVLWHYRLGRELALFRGEPSRFKYGQRRIPALARTLTCSADLLTKSLAFVAELPDEAEVDRLAQLGVQWSHFVTARSVPDRQERRSLLEKAAKEGWTVVRLRHEVRRRLGGPQHAGSGRPPRPPQRGAPEIDLEDLIAKANQWDRFLDKTWLAKKGVLTELKQVGGRRVNDSLQKLLNRAAQALTKVGRRIQNVKRGLQEIGSKDKRA